MDYAVLKPNLIIYIFFNLMLIKQSLSPCYNGLCCLENKYDNRYLELDYLEMDVNEKEILSHCHNDFWCFQNINING